MKPVYITMTRRQSNNQRSDGIAAHPTPKNSQLYYHLFPGLKKQLKGRHFSSDAEVIAAVETWLDGQPSKLFFEWLAKVRAMD